MSNIFSNILRPIGALLAVIAMLALSIHALGLHYNDVFVKTLYGIREAIGHALFLDDLELLIKRVADYFGVPKFRLEPWWRDTFVLLWLFNGAWVRNFAQGWGNFVPSFLWGGMTALFVGAATGAVPLDSPAMFMWPLAGFLLFLVGRSIIGNYANWSGALFVPAAAGCVWVGYVANKPFDKFYGFAVNVPSLGLLSLAGLIFLVSLWMVVGGLWETAGSNDLSLAERFKNPAAATGRDILAVYLFATVLAVIGLLLAG